MRFGCISHFVQKYWFIWLAIAVLNFSPHIAIISNPNELASRDITQLYLMGKASAAGISPYLTIAELRAQFLGITTTYQQHPTPYPPIQAVIMSLGSTISLSWFYIAYLFGSITCLFFSVGLLARVAGLTEQSKRFQIAITALFTIFCVPVRESFAFAQMDLFLLFLFSYSIHCILMNRHSVGAAYFAFTVQLKTLGWLCLIPISIKHKNAAIAAIVAVLTGSTIAISTLGYKEILNYFGSVASLVSREYMLDPGNQSLHSLWFSMIHHVSIMMSNDGSIRTLSSSSIISVSEFFWFAAPVTISLSLLVLYLVRESSFRIQLAVTLLSTILLSPVSWIFYFILLLIVSALLMGDESISPAQKIQSNILIGLIIFINWQALGHMGLESDASNNLVTISSIRIVLNKMPLILGSLLFIQLMVLNSDHPIPARKVHS